VGGWVGRMGVVVTEGEKKVEDTLTRLCGSTRLYLASTNCLVEWDHTHNTY